MRGIAAMGIRGTFFRDIGPPKAFPRRKSLLFVSATGTLCFPFVVKSLFYVDPLHPGGGGKGHAMSIHVSSGTSRPYAPVLVASSRHVPANRASATLTHAAPAAMSGSHHYCASVGPPPGDVRVVKERNGTPRCVEIPRAARYTDIFIHLVYSRSSFAPSKWATFFRKRLM
jgi:hypothetical protein